MISYLKRFVYGILIIQLEGRQVKRFLKLCTCQGINVWNVKYINSSTYVCSICWNDIYKTKPCLRKTRTKLKIISKKGFPLWVRFWKRHIFLLLFIILTIYLVFSFQKYIWHIEINGNLAISDETIIKKLCQYGVETGEKKSDINSKKIEDYLRINIDEICWSSVYIKGTCLYVDVEEEHFNSASDIQRKDDLFSNIYARCDSTISTVIIRRGIGQVKKGDIVKKGDLLVSGECPIFDDNLEIKQYMKVNSDADIWGNVEYEFREEIPLYETKLSKTGNKYRTYQFRLFNYEINFPHLGKKYNKSQITENYKQLKIGKSFYLPLYYGISLNEEIKEKKITNKKEKASAILNKKLDYFLEEKQNDGAKVLSKQIKFEKISSKYVLYGKIWTCELIGVRK